RTTVPYHHRQRLPLTLATLPRRLHRKSFDLPELATNPRSHARRSRPSTLDRRCSRTWTIPTRNAMRAKNNVAVNCPSNAAMSRTAVSAALQPRYEPHRKGLLQNEGLPAEKRRENRRRPPGRPRRMRRYLQTSRMRKLFPRLRI